MTVGELAEAVAKMHKLWGKALAHRERLEAERSISLYRARASIRSDYEVRGEKITEGRLDEQARLAPEVEAAIAQHVQAIESCENAQAELLLARMKYEIQMKA